MAFRIYEALKTFINTILGIIAFFLVLRMVFRFFSANPATPLVNWIFGVSSFLIAPFAGIVPNPTVPTGILDMVAIISLFSYAIVGLLLLTLTQGLIESTTTEEYTEEEYPATVHYHEVSRRKKVSHP